MISDELHDSDRTDLYERIARQTGEDVETIASFGFELYAPAFHEEQKEKVRSRRRYALRKKAKTRRAGGTVIAE